MVKKARKKIKSKEKTTFFVEKCVEIVDNFTCGKPRAVYLALFKTDCENHQKDGMKNG
jgi:hypothetical protein